MTEILLGFEVDTGNPVYIDDGHTTVTGITQLSGKTTCLEALVKRGNIRCVTFLTKRGESGFKNQREIQPYFKEQKKGRLIDWQYVSAILQAVMSEKMKLERSFIINACKGAKSLQEVYENIKDMRNKTRRGFDESIYTNLAAYFEIILPEIDKYTFASKLDLQKGFNVMNLIDMKDEMQHLIIQSTIDYILKRMKNVVVVIPEAHKFIPQHYKTPSKLAALRFIKEGAALRNYMWIDSQETTSVDKAILKQCSNWIMGYQNEKNEVANVRANLGRRRVSEEQIMSLKLGHFIASLKREISHVYVLPAGVPEDMGISVARGEIEPEQVTQYILGVRKEEKDLYREKYEETLNELTELRNDFSKFKGDVSQSDEMFDGQYKRLKADNERLQKITEEQQEDIERLNEVENAINTLREILQVGSVRPVVATGKEIVQNEVLVEHELTGLEVTYKRNTIETDTESLMGRIALLYSEGIFDPEKFYKISDIMLHFEARGWGGKQPKASTILRDMTKMGFFIMRKIGNRPEFRALMSADDARETGFLKVKEVVV